MTTHPTSDIWPSERGVGECRTRIRVQLPDGGVGKGGGVSISSWVCCCRVGSDEAPDLSVTVDRRDESSGDKRNGKHHSLGDRIKYKVPIHIMERTALFEPTG